MPGRTILSVDKHLQAVDAPAGVCVGVHRHVAGEGADIVGALAGVCEATAGKHKRVSPTGAQGVDGPAVVEPV